MVACFTVYLFLGVINTENNQDHPLYGREFTQRFGLTDSEYAGLFRLREVSESAGDVPVMVDFDLYSYLKLYPAKRLPRYWNEIDLDSFSGLFPVRAVYFERPFLVGDSARDLDLSSENILQIYDSGDFQIMEHISPSLPQVE